MLTIRESFRRFRKHFDLTQADVASVLNIKATSYKYELNAVAGKELYPTGKALIKLSKKFNVSTDYLLGLTDDPRPFRDSTPDTSSSKPSEQEAELLSAKPLQLRLARIESALMANGIQF